MGEGGHRVLPPDCRRRWGPVQKGLNPPQATDNCEDTVGEGGGRKNILDVERLEKEILGLREQLSRIAENVVAKDQQLGKLDADYRTLRRTERHVAKELARERQAHDETKEERNGLKLMMRQVGGQLWRRGC